MTLPSDPVLELKELQEYFAGRLPERLAELEEAWAAVTASGWEPERLRTLHRLAHSLTGAGSTFGYPEVVVHHANGEVTRMLIDDDPLPRYGQTPGTEA